MKRRMTVGEQAGLGLMTITGAFGIWSASNSSIFAVKNWAKDEETKKNARTGMNMGLVAITGLSLGSWLLTRKPWIAVATMGTGIALYGYYEYLLRSNGETKELPKVNV